MRQLGCALKLEFCTAVITLFFSLISVQVARVRTRWWRLLFLIIASFDAFPPGPSLTELDGGQDRWEVVTANRGGCWEHYCMLYSALLPLMYLFS